MAQTNVNIRRDIELKKQFNAFCEDMEMSQIYITHSDLF